MVATALEAPVLGIRLGTTQRMEDHVALVTAMSWLHKGKVGTLQTTVKTLCSGCFEVKLGSCRKGLANETFQWCVGLGQICETKVTNAIIKGGAHDAFFLLVTNNTNNNNDNDFCL